MVRVTLEIKGFDDVDYVRNEFMKYCKVFYDNIKISVEKINELTEDERVILRNIVASNIKAIGRENSALYLRESTGDINYFINYMYRDLFQFIKEGEEYSIEELLK